MRRYYYRILGLEFTGLQVVILIFSVAAIFCAGMPAVYIFSKGIAQLPRPAVTTGISHAPTAENPYIPRTDYEWPQDELPSSSTPATPSPWATGASPAASPTPSPTNPMATEPEPGNTPIPQESDSPEPTAQPTLKPSPIPSEGTDETTGCETGCSPTAAAT